MKKYIFLIIIFTFLPLVTSLDQTQVICGGNEELQILCIGDDELSSGIFKEVVESDFVGASGTFIDETIENFRKLQEQYTKLGIKTSTTYLILGIGAFFLISLFIIMLVLLDKKRKRKK